MSSVIHPFGKREFDFTNDEKNVNCFLMEFKWNDKLKKIAERIYE